MKSNKSLYEHACEIMPGGVNSPVRAFKSVGGTPPYIKSGKGATVIDVEGKEYIDYLGSWGPLILGHAREEVVEAVRETAGDGLSFGACHEKEIEIAELIKECMPHIEMCRMVNSGTEATMSALRLARGITDKDKVIKFQGCYHGHGDSFLIAAGSGALTFGTPSSPGITNGAAQDTLLASYNDIKSVENIFAERHDIGAIIVEPVAGNMGVILPEEDFLFDLRKICDKNDCILIFDEVITGFRLGTGGASGKYSVTPDLITLGKIVGGGMPVGVYGGKKDLMKHISPTGEIYQAGTLAGNPVACAAGIATIKILIQENPYENLRTLSEKLINGTKENFAEAGVPCQINNIESMATLFFTEGEVKSYEAAMQSNTSLYAKYHKGMMERGVYLAPSQFEAMFVSTAHTEDHIQKTLEIQREVLKSF
jgi:glutamate-1-semialdehyde 2,1-aminomutase